jgi:CHAT domain-containing protein/tetratricopeptide (TPR) repeat protein
LSLHQDSTVVMNLSKFGTITAISLFTLISSSITTGILPGHSIQVLAQTQDNRQAEAERLLQQGVEQYQTSQFQAALQSWQQALEIYQEIGDRTGEGTIRNHIGSVYFYQGQYPRALESYQQALSILQEVGDRVGEGRTLTGIGNVYFYQGQYPQALESYQQALSILQEVGDRVGEGTTLTGIGNVYFYQGQYPQALESYQQALSILQEVGDRVGEEITLNNIGLVYLYQGQCPQALESYQQALSILQEVGDRVGEEITRGNIGLVYLCQGQYPQALESLQQTLSILQEAGDRVAEGGVLSNIGLVYFNQGQHPQALESYQQALSVIREVGDRAGEGTILSNIGASLFQSGQLQSAETALLEALTVLDELRQQGFNDADRISLFDTQVYAYEILQQVQITQNKIEPALETSERGRARPFVSLLSQRLQQTEATANLPIPSVSDIQQTARAQNATLVQYSVMSTMVDTPAIYIWVIPPTGDIAFRSVELNEANQRTFSGAIATDFGENTVFRSDSTTISNLVSNVRPTSRSASRDIEFEYNPTLATDSLRQLHQLLIEPIADLLPTNESDRIVFIPQGGLFLVPFAALQDTNGDYLIEKHTISIAPSIQVLDITRQQQNDERSPQNALIVGNPVMPQVWDTQTSTEVPLAPLPGAEREAQAIAQFLNTEAITGEAATETAITEQMPTAQIIHLATHGLLEYGIPSDSGVLDVPGAIALTPSSNEDGLLTSAEILEMDLQAELVVLSACDTGRGQITGDGVVGLSRALISAGVPSVVVSLWSVPDALTANLMTEFYRQLETQPDKAQALRQAMLITMQQHPDPRDWAAFSLIGEAQ